MTTNDAYRKSGFVVPEKSRKTVRSYAHYLIDHVETEIGWKDRQQFPISDLLEMWSAECGPNVGRDRPGLDILESNELPHADAEFVPHLNLIRVDEDIWDAACDGDSSARWVLAHETGHVVLKHYAAAGLYCESDRAVKPEVDSEHQANWFADELLMDSRKINAISDGTRALTQRFHVSEKMAARRLRELILETKSK